MATRGLDRRTLLRTGRNLAVGAVVGMAPFLNARGAWAAVPDSLEFKLNGAGGNPMLKQPLHANWVMQSFGYDNESQRMYFLQHKPGMTNGDIWVTRTDVSGHELGAMALHGFGHGVSVGVERHLATMYLWTEWDTSPSGFGRRIGRFPFVDGATLEVDSPLVQDRTPTFDSMINPQPAIDPYTQRLAVRYRDGTTTRTRIAVFSLDAVRNRRPTLDDRLIERHLPDVDEISDWPLEETDPPAFQGYAVCGRYAYLLCGDAGSSEHSYIVTVDLNSSGMQHSTPFLTSAGQNSLPGREAQGMAIWVPASGLPRLCFGFHSNTDGVRQASVFYKSEYV